MHNHFRAGREWPGPFAEGMRHGRRFKRGLLKFAVLRLLADQSRHGYDLIRMFRRNGWAGGASSIYPLLASLEEEGLIAGRDEGDRRTYEVTEQGRRLLDERVGDEGFFEDAGEDGEDESRRLLREAAGRLMQAVGQLGGGSKPETVDSVRDLLDRARKDIYTLLARE